VQIATRIAQLIKTSNSNLFDSLLFFLTPLLYLLPDYLYSNFVLYLTQCQIVAQELWKLHQQKLTILICLYIPNLLHLRQEKKPKLIFFLHFFFLSKNNAINRSICLLDRLISSHPLEGAEGTSLFF